MAELAVEAEDDLQGLLERNPQLLSEDQGSSTVAPRWILVAREMASPPSKTLLIAGP